jgi:hypothetical protein
MTQSLPAFTAPGRFWRGNLHTHSTRSDGVLAPEEVCRRYLAEGYDFLALTDHFVGLYDYPIVDTCPMRTNTFTTILGAELHSGAMANGELWHILAVGLPADFAPANAPHFEVVAGQETGAQIAARAVAAGAFVAIAHPQWSGMTLADAQGITAAHAVEIYNHGCAVGCDRPDGAAIADLLLTEGRGKHARGVAGGAESGHVLFVARPGDPRYPDHARCGGGGLFRCGIGCRAGRAHGGAGHTRPVDDNGSDAAGSFPRQPVHPGDSC